jgi:HAD superfamily phosphatase
MSVRAKAAGDANNDWILTHRLLRTRGVETTLEEVTRRFEALYQGNETEPGLWHVEQLLVTPDLLGRLASRLPLGIVTGRPRRDAERFLTHTGIHEHFAALVCMEDAPRKPDPAPVRLLMEQLEVHNAWLVGDTPDDMRAAAAAGVLPLAVIAPGDPAEATTHALLESGAERILENVGELEERLAFSAGGNDA